MNDTGDSGDSLERQTLTIKDIGYIGAGIVFAITTAVTVTGTFWHESGRTDLLDQRITTMQVERDDMRKRRDDQVAAIERADSVRDAKLATLTDSFSDLRAQIAALSAKQDSTNNLLQTLITKVDARESRQ